MTSEINGKHAARDDGNGDMAAPDITWPRHHGARFESAVLGDFAACVWPLDDGSGWNWSVSPRGTTAGEMGTAADRDSARRMAGCVMRDAHAIVAGPDEDEARRWAGRIAGDPLFAGRDGVNGSSKESVENSGDCC